MSALARLFLHDGKTVSGSDINESELTNKLKNAGMSVVYEQTADNIKEDIDFVVYTEAMSKDHPELTAAQTLGVPVVNYFEALGMVANEYYLIAVSGTHGKSTTTAMLIDIFEEAGYDPSGIVGSLRSKTGSNYRAGKSKYMILEACEYKRDFLTLEPDVLVITNIEHEHVDYYKNLTDVQLAFRELAEKVPAEGAVICDTGDVNVQPVIENLVCRVIDYRQSFNPMLNLKLPGVHNQLNAAAALAAAASIEIAPETSKQALEDFSGIWRRFEYKGEVSGALIYDDYAHHPTEIKAAIAGARERYPDKNIVVVYQPHTYSRTYELFDGFVEALSAADRVLLVPIYAAREDNKSGVSSEQLAKKIGSKSVYTTSLEAANNTIKETVSSDDVVIVMGAGNITAIANDLVT